jgi:AcrR family transcriptional regulator
VARRHGWGGNPPRSESEASQRIVAAAVELIATTGADITIADLASSLGVIRPTIYRYFPSADAVMKAAAIASVDGFLDRLEAHLRGITDPAESMTECVAYTLEAIPRTPHLGLLLGPGHSPVHSQEVTSAQAQEFGRSMIRRFDVDWEHYGYDEAALGELVEFVLRTTQSFLVAPGDPPRDAQQLRRYLRRWLGGAILAQPR